MRRIVFLYAVSMTFIAVALADRAEAQVRGGGLRPEQGGGANGAGRVAGIDGIPGVKPLPDLGSSGLNTGVGLNSEVGSTSTSTDGDGVASTRQGRRRGSSSRSSTPQAERHRRAVQAPASTAIDSSGETGGSGESDGGDDTDPSAANGSWWNWVLGIAVLCLLLSTLGGRERR